MSAAAVPGPGVGRPGLPDPSTLRALRAQARRLSRCDADAEDLLQEVLLAALQARRADPAWLSGVLRRQAALAVRTAVRRRRRERAAAGPPEVGPGPGDGPEREACATQLLSTLPPASRRVVELALHGLGAAEIRWLLGIPEAAFRQRVAVVRRTVAAQPPELRRAIRSLAEAPADGGRPRSGPLRRALKAAMRGTAAVGTHDHDGHLLLVDRPAHVRAPAGNG